MTDLRHALVTGGAGFIGSNLVDRLVLREEALDGFDGLSALIGHGLEASVDTSILKGSVSAVKEALATGDHDGHLADLLAAEEGGKARKGAIAAIKARM